MIESSGFSSCPTQRERADRETLRQKTYLDELFELSPDAVVLTTLRNPRILRINREFTRMFGYTSEEADRKQPSQSGHAGWSRADPPRGSGFARRTQGGVGSHSSTQGRHTVSRSHTGKRVELSDDGDAAYLISGTSARASRPKPCSRANRGCWRHCRGWIARQHARRVMPPCRGRRRSSLTSILLLDRTGRIHPGAGPSLPPSYVAAIDGAPVGLGTAPAPPQRISAHK